MTTNRTGLVIGILILVIMILIGFVSYAFVLKPTLNGYVISGYNQGYSDAIIQIAQQATTCQQVPLTIGNQSINMIAVECLQQAQPQ